MKTVDAKGAHLTISLLLATWPGPEDPESVPISSLAQYKAACLISCTHRWREGQDQPNEHDSHGACWFCSIFPKWLVWESVNEDTVEWARVAEGLALSRGRLTGLEVRYQ